MQNIHEAFLHFLQDHSGMRLKAYWVAEGRGAPHRGHGGNRHTSEQKSGWWLLFLTENWALHFKHVNWFLHAGHSQSAWKRRAVLSPPLRCFLPHCTQGGNVQSVQ